MKRASKFLALAIFLRCWQFWPRRRKPLAKSKLTTKKPL